MITRLSLKTNLNNIKLDLEEAVDKIKKDGHYEEVPIPIEFALEHVSQVIDIQTVLGVVKDMTEKRAKDVVGPWVFLSEGEIVIEAKKLDEGMNKLKVFEALRNLMCRRRLLVEDGTDPYEKEYKPYTKRSWAYDAVGFHGRHDE